MRSVEVSAKTREEAIGIALEQLGVDRDEVHVEIVDEGSKGLFGFGARPVKLRVSTEVAGPEPRQQRREPRREPRREQPSRRQDQKERPQQRREPRSESRPPREAAPKPAPKPERNLSPADPNTVTEAASLLKEVIKLMGIDATVTSQATDDGGICLKIDSPDSAILIGRKGRNLTSMQYLMNRMVNTGDGEDSERIVIDIEGYLDRRQEALEDMAQRQAQRAKETRQRVRLKPMSSQERRVIHMVLENDPDVKTFSVGDGALRTVVIAPNDELPESEQRPPRRRGGSRRGGGGGSPREREHASADSANANGGDSRGPRRGSRRGGRGRRRRGPGGPREESQVAANSESASGEGNDS
ncbi:MAG: hypothetical protein AMXMBFR82_37800 [Candidatus Hydrogenedentota bacterium]